MKQFFTYTFILLSLFVQATNYYVKVGGGTGAGTSDGTAWSYAKLNATALVAGDSVFFKKGNTFYGSLTVRNGVVYSSYGKGVNPVVTGFQTLSSWTNEGSGVYSAAITATVIRSVLFNGAMQRMGRYPNANASNGGYLNITSSTSTTNFGVTSLAGTWIGATAVVRSAKWSLDMKTITAQTGTDLTVQALNYKPKIGFGMFIQNHRNTLDQLGEWFFSSNRLYVYFGANNPADYVVKASNVDDLINAASRSNVTFISITIEGANRDGMTITSSTNVRLYNCSIKYSGRDAASGRSHTGFMAEGCTLEWNNARGFMLTSSNGNITLRNNTVKNTGMIAGAAQPGSGGVWGIAIGGDNITVYGNTIDSVGYAGIIYAGNNIIIRKNKFTNYCYVTDDGAGAYSFNSDSLTYYRNRIIDSCIFDGGNSQSFYGTTSTSSSQEGIYCDDNSRNITITNCFIANNGRSGIYVHNASNIIIRNNTLYNNKLRQLGMSNQNPNCQMRIWGCIVVGNVFISKASTQNLAEFYTHYKNIATFGRIDSNAYVYPVTTAARIKVLLSTASNCTITSMTSNSYTLSGWKELYGHDAHSTITPTGVSTTEAD